MCSNQVGRSGSLEMSSWAPVNIVALEIDRERWAVHKDCMTNLMANESGFQGGHLEDEELYRSARSNGGRLQVGLMYLNGYPRG